MRVVVRDIEYNWMRRKFVAQEIRCSGYRVSQDYSPCSDTMKRSRQKKDFAGMYFIDRRREIYTQLDINLLIILFL